MALSWMCACTLRAPYHTKFLFLFSHSPAPLPPAPSNRFSPVHWHHETLDTRTANCLRKKHFLKTFSRKTLTASHSCDMSVHIPLVVVEEVGRWCGRAVVSEKSFIDESIAEEATFAFWSLKWDLCQNKDLGVVWSCFQVHLQFGKGSS